MSQVKRTYIPRHKAEPRGLVAVLRRALALSAPVSPLAVLEVEEEES